MGAKKSVKPKEGAKPRKKAKPVQEGVKPKLGRPSMYSEELADKICLAISTGEKGLNHLCAANEEFPNPKTVYEWIITNDSFSKKYARARELQAEFMAEKMIEIADDSTNDTIIGYSKSGEPMEMENKEWVNRSKLKVDTRKWLMSKLAPKRFGDKIDVTHTVKKLGKDLETDNESYE